MALNFLLVWVAYFTIRCDGTYEVGPMKMVYPTTTPSKILTVASSEDFAEDPVYKQEHCIKITPEKEKQLKAFIYDVGNYITELHDKYEDIDIRFVKIDIEKHSEDEVDEKDMILKVIINDCHQKEDIPNPAPKTDKINDKNEQNVSNSHHGVDTQVQDESNNANDVNSFKNNQQNQGVPYQGNSNEQANIHNAGYQTLDNQGVFNANANSFVSGSQNQEQNQHVTIGGANQGNHGVNDSATRNCVGDHSALAANVRPTVQFLELPENGQRLMEFLESRRKKKIEPLWVYIMEEEDGKKEYVVFE